MTAATITALAAAAVRAHAKQERRLAASERWADKRREFMEGALKLPCPVASGRWHLRAGYCGWLALRHQRTHRAAELLAAGFPDAAAKAIREARHAMHWALEARRLADEVVA